MIRDTNPDHYKVDGANFLEYMNDPKISGFGNWMFANGFNSGVWASTNWISVKDRLPEPEEKVLVYTKTGCLKYAQYHDEPNVANPWYVYEDQARAWTNVISHWMQLPEAPKEDGNA